MSKVLTNKIEPKSGDSITTDKYIQQKGIVRFVARGNDDSYISTTPIPFPTVEQNVGNGYNSSTYKFTCPVAGTYMFQVNMGIVQIPAAGNYGYFSLKKNNTTAYYGYNQTPTSTGYHNTSMNIMLECAVGDVIHVDFNRSGSATYYNDAAESWFSGYLIG